jgi:hypothetical protein
MGAATLLVKIADYSNVMHLLLFVALVRPNLLVSCAVPVVVVVVVVAHHARQACLLVMLA